jgi:hypothetical protein
LKALSLEPEMKSDAASEGFAWAETRRAFGTYISGEKLMIRVRNVKGRRPNSLESSEIQKMQRANQQNTEKRVWSTTRPNRGERGELVDARPHAPMHG